MEDENEEVDEDEEEEEEGGEDDEEDGLFPAVSFKKVFDGLVYRFLINYLFIYSEGGLGAFFLLWELAES